MARIVNNHVQAVGVEPAGPEHPNGAELIVKPGDGTKKKFVQLATTADPDVHSELRAELVTQHLRLANQLARRFVNRGEALDDLVQVASLALIKSVDRFDPDRGIEFNTFATRTMVGELKRHFRDRGWAVRAPRRIQELYLELGQTIERLSHRLSRSPTVSELACAVKEPEELVIEALEAGKAYRAASIDAPDREDEVLANRIGSSDVRFTSVEDRSVLAPALARLSPRERKILRLRFVDGLTQSDIAERVGVSQMHVSRILSSSLRHLRKEFPGGR